MDFKDTDSLINHLDRCVHFLTISCKLAQGVLLQKRYPDLFNTLVEISKGTASEEEKQEQRYLVFADTYKKPGDLEFGKKMLNYKFNEQSYIDFMNLNSHLLGISEEISKIEAEFWRNCPDPKNINLLCNIYRERWNGHLYEVDLEYYDWENFLYKDTSHPLYINFKALRDCGLIRAKETEFECRIVHVAQRINFLVVDIVSFFKKMRSSVIDTMDLPGPAEQQNISPDNFTLMKANLTKYGFFELEKVSKVKESELLVQLLIEKQVPYQVAMLDFLNFTLHIKKNYSENKIGKRDKILAEVIGAKTDRVKKNMLVLNPFSNADRKEYTAHTFKKTVENDYTQLL